LLEFESQLEQTALLRVPGADLVREGVVMARRDVEPPEIWIYSTTWIVDPTTFDAFARKKHPKLFNVCMMRCSMQISPSA
jgi:hypothetical protein